VCKKVEIDTKRPKLGRGAIAWISLLKPKLHCLDLFDTYL